jgi:hypothetical protein
MDANNNGRALGRQFLHPSLRRALLLWLMWVAAPFAQATLITFDDLAQNACEVDQENSSCEPLAVVDQYAALGVHFNGAALIVAAPGDEAVVSPPNYISDFWGPGLDITFSGALPTAVSLLVSSYVGNASYIDAYGSDGALIHSVITAGNRGLDIPAPDYTPRQLVSFAGAEIARIHLIDLYERRGFLGLDNLSFTRDATAVPEPSTLVLIVAGLLASLFARSIAPRRFL